MTATRHGPPFLARRGAAMLRAAPRTALGARPVPWARVADALAALLAHTGTPLVVASGSAIRHRAATA